MKKIGILFIQLFLCLYVSAQIEVGAVTASTSDTPCNGTIEVIANGDAGPFTITLNSGESVSGTNGSHTFNDLCEGIYTITVEFEGYESCMVVLEAEVSSDSCPGSPIIVNVDKDFPTCKYDTDGSITINVEGGIPPYSYEWTNNSWNGSRVEKDLVNIGVGTYELKIVDACGQMTFETVNLQNKFGYMNVRTTQVTNLSSASAQDGEIAIQTTGGTPPYTFFWIGSDGFSLSEQNNTGYQHLTGLSAGTYNLMVTDNNGCEVITSIMVSTNCGDDEVVPSIRIDANVTDVNSTGASNGDIDVEISGGIPPYSYHWTGPNGFNSTDSKLALIPPGEYFLTVTDKCGNQALERMVVCDLIQIDGEVDASCMGITDNEIIENGGFDVCWGLGYIGGENSNGVPQPINIQGGIGPYAYLWKHEDDEDWYTITSNGQSMQPYHDHACEGETSILVIDQLGCRSETTFTLTASSDGSNDYEERIEDIFVAPYGAASSVPSQCQNPYSIDVTERLFCRKRYYCTSTGRLLDTDVRKITIRQDSNSEQCDYTLRCDGEEIDESLYHFTSDGVCTINTECGDVVYCITRLLVRGRYMGHVYRIGEETTFELEESYEMGNNFDGSQICIKVFRCPLSGEIVRRIYDADTQPEYRTIFVGTEPPFLRCDLCTLCEEEEVDRYEVPLEVCYRIRDKNPVAIDNCDEDDKLKITPFSNNGFVNQSIYKTNNTETFSLNNLSFDNEYLGGKTEFGIEATDRTYTEIKSKNIDTDADNVFATGYFTESESNTEQDIFVQKYYHNNKIAWTRQFIGAGDDVANDVSVGKLDKTYVTGYFNQEIEFGLNTLNSESQDIFVSKLYSNGYPEWSKQAGGSGIDEALSIDVNNFGNSFVTGYITGTATFDEYTTNTPDDKQSMFIAKYRADGVAEWVKTGVLDANVDFENSMLVTDSEGNVIVAGDYTGDFTLEGLTTPLRAGSSLGKAAFIAKYSPSGQVLWAERVGKSSGIHLTSIVIDEQDNVTVAGEFTGTGDFTNGAYGDLLVSEQASKDIFFAKFDKNGRIFWLKQAGAENDEVIHDLTTDGAGRFAYVATVTGITTLEGDTYEAADGAENCITTDFACDASIEHQITKASCDLNNGAIDITVTATERTDVVFEYEWSHNAQTTEDLTGLDAGLYRVTVTDDEDCAFTREYEVARVPSLAAELVVNDAFCNFENGSIYVRTSGGVPPYTYRWESGHRAQSINGLAAGDYQVSVYDATGCLNVQSTTLENIASDIEIVEVVAAACYGGVNGSIDIAVSGGYPPYSYLWSTQSATTQDIDNLSPGTYSVTVTDASNCRVSKDIVVPDVDNTVLNATVLTHAGCGQNTGSITANTADRQFNIYYENLDDPNVSGSTNYNPNNGTDVVFTDLPAGLYLIKTFANASDCYPTQTLRILNDLGAGQNGRLTVASDLIHTKCGAANGAIDLTIKDGSANYSGSQSDISYEWSDGANTTDRSDLAAGIYTVTITREAALESTDIFGNTVYEDCTFSQSFEIESSDRITGYANKIDASCKNCADGEVRLNMTHETTQYNVYEWSNGANTEDIEGLLPGIYTVTITQTNTQCELVITAEVGFLSDCIVETEISVTDASSYAAADGQATVTPISGIAPFKYEWSSGHTTATASGLSAGSYEVVVTDDLGCQAVLVVEVNQPPCDLDANLRRTAISCNVCRDASITAEPSGGASPYTYTWSNGTNAATADGLGKGVYIVTITDALGCFIVRSTKIEPCDLNASISTIAGTCRSKGSVTITPSGGEAPYQYKWRVRWNEYETTTNNTRSLAPGRHSVEIIDNIGCTLVEQFDIGNDDETVIASIAVEEENGGSFTLGAFAEGGTSPYTYKWSDHSTEQRLVGVGYGSYAVTVTSREGCSGYADIFLEVDCNEFEVKFSSSAASCADEAGGSITAFTKGGENPIKYRWSTGETTKTISNLSAGITYTVTVTDVNDCVASASTVLGGPDAIVLNMSSTPETLVDSKDGTASVSVSGGTSPYQYKWSNNATTPNISNLSAGIYKLTVTDNNDCVAYGSVAVGKPNCDILVRGLAVVNPKCHNSNDGFIEIEASAGSGNYTYKWSRGSSTSSINSGLAEGQYEVTVTDEVGCEAIWSTSLTAPAPISIEFRTQHVTTTGGSDGRVTAIVEGGVSPYEYEWLGQSSTTSTIENVSKGTYTLVVTDANGCTGTQTASVKDPDCADFEPEATSTPPSCHDSEDGSITIHLEEQAGINYDYDWDDKSNVKSRSDLGNGVHSITVSNSVGCLDVLNIELRAPEPIAVSSTVTHVSTVGGSDGEIVLEPRGGTPNYTYDWEHGPTSSTVSGLSQGVYSVDVKDSKNCQINTSIAVNEPNCSDNPISIDITSSDVLCYGEATGSASINVSGGDGNYTISGAFSQNNSTINGLVKGDYSVQVKDGKGCYLTKKFKVEEPAPITIEFSTRVPDCGQSNGEINAFVGGGTSEYTYRWSGDKTGSGKSITQLNFGTYHLLVTDGNGCTTSETVILKNPNSNICDLNLDSDGGDEGFSASYGPYSEATNLSITFDSYTVPDEVSFKSTKEDGSQGAVNFSSECRGDADTYKNDPNQACLIPAGYYKTNFTLPACEKLTISVNPNCGCGYTSGTAWTLSTSCGTSVSRTESGIKEVPLEERKEEITDTEYRAPKVNIYPNPFNDYLNIDIRSTQTQELKIQLFDIMGRLLHVETLDAQVGLNQTQIDLSTKAISSGVYQVVVSGKDMSPQNFKVVRVE